jgi:hypothetical protein
MRKISLTGYCKENQFFWFPKRIFTFCAVSVSLKEIPIPRRFENLSNITFVGLDPFPCNTNERNFVGSNWYMGSVFKQWEKER